MTADVCMALQGYSPVDFLRMATDDNDDFSIRVGRSRSRGTGVNRGARTFVGQVNIAVRKAGGDPNRIAGQPGRAAGASTREGAAPRLRGREDRHQFRFIVTPEDSAEMGDLRGFTAT